MNAMKDWLAANDGYLATEVAELRQRLERLAGAAEHLVAPPQASARPGAGTAGLSLPMTLPAPSALTAGTAPVVTQHGFLWRWRHRVGAPAGAPAGSAAVVPAATSTVAPVLPAVPAPPLELAAPAPDPALSQLEAEAAEHPPALRLLVGRFGLTDFERCTLLLCAAMELDTRIAGLCARAQGDGGRPYPTFALALAAFDEPEWDVLSPERPLRFWRLVEIQQAAGQPLMSAALKADERIVNFLKGLNYLDDRLAPLVVPVPAGPVALAPSQQAAVAAVVDRVGAGGGGGRLTLFQLVGNDSDSKVAVASQVAAQLDLALYRLAPDSAPTESVDQENFVRLWQRESALLPIGLYIDGADVERGPGPQAAVVRMCRRGMGMALIDVREPWPELLGVSHTVEVAKPTSREQRNAWIEVVAGAADDPGVLPGRLAGQFNFNLATIGRLAAGAGHPLDEAALWDACRRESRPSLAHLAQAMIPLARWDDLELADTEKRTLHQIADQVARRVTVYDDWGFRERMNRGLGISVLFAGESGTGKTMAAEVIANELHLALYRIDLSAVVSKYIGETEKNLRQLFDGADDGGAILFFDEADALFGQRSEVKDSHDRYANIEINYLLQRMEAYRGLAILATNAKAALDRAFVRRLRFIVDFRFPGVEQRQAIWQKAFPPQMPVDPLDYRHLARFNLAGGSIHNVAVNAAFLAAQAGGSVSMALVLDAVRSEFAKLEKPVSEADFRWLGPVEAAG
jgi:hypothetical protein